MGCSRVVTNSVLEHKVLKITFRFKVSKATSSGVLFIGVSRDTSMTGGYRMIEVSLSFIILDVVPYCLVYKCPFHNPSLVFIGYEYEC